MFNNIENFSIDAKRVMCIISDKRLNLPTEFEFIL